MNITSEILDNGILKIKLAGRLDLMGAQSIDLPFTSLVATKAAAVIVDISEVSFLASLGIRTFLLSAKALANRGGKLVLLNPQPNVYTVLETSDVLDVLCVSMDNSEALAHLADFLSS